MKKTYLIAAILMLTTVNTFAHYLWIETSANGLINQKQEVRVYFGEYTYGLIEKVNGDAFPSVSNFSISVVDQSGIQTEIKVTPNKNFYSGYFTPASKGVYTVVLNNNNINVIDYTKYDFGVFKTHYHSVAKVNVGNVKGITKAINDRGITIKDISENKEEVKLQVLFKNKPLSKNEIKVFVSDEWSKELETDENGIVSFKLPWQTKYIVETTKKEEVSGSYNGKDYEFIWHCVTYCIL